MNAIVRLLLSGLLGYTAWLKLTSPDDRAWLPVWVQVVVALMEVTAVIGIWSRYAGFASKSLLALCGVGLAWAAFGQDSIARCGCLGRVSLPIQDHVALIAGIGALAALSAIAGPPRWPFLRRSLRGPDVQ